MPSKPTGQDVVLYVRLYGQLYFKINLAFLFFILPLQIKLTVLENLNNFEAS